MKLVSAGETNETLVTLIRDNVRVQDEVMGDIWAQVSCVRTLGQRLVEFLADVQLDLSDLGELMCDRSDIAMREAARALPDGDYTNEMVVEGSEGEIRICCRLSVRGDEIAIDYEGSSPQVSQAINVVPSYTFAYSAYALKCLLSPEVPNNDGSFRSISTIAPLGSILNPRFPAPVGARAMTGHLLPPLIMGALDARTGPSCTRLAALGCSTCGVSSGSRLRHNLLFERGARCLPQPRWACYSKFPEQSRQHAY
jgi:N-methylhydantoinase B